MSPTTVAAPAQLALALALPRLPDVDVSRDLPLFLVALGALVASGFLALLGATLRRAVPARILEEARTEERAQGVARGEELATGAIVLLTLVQVLFVVASGGLLLRHLPGSLAAAVLFVLGVPLLVVAREVPSGLLHGPRQDAFLARTLPAIRWVLLPVAVLARPLEGLRRALLGVMRLPAPPRLAHRLAQDLRVVLEESDLEEELDATERELIENVVEFHDVDVAEVMTPRTELRAVEAGSCLEDVARTIAESGHTRIPVFRGNLDTIVGVVYAQDVVRLLTGDPGSVPSLSQLAVPVSFVPETKRVSELLTELRRDRRKIAVVLDEYGGTAGIVTLGDLVEELVGDIRQELGEATPVAIRRLEEQHYEILASTRISEVNEALELDLPEEEDYETLAGFVLSELGHFPKRGESFEKGGVRYVVTEANDRRVFVVRVRLGTGQGVLR